MAKLSAKKQGALRKARVHRAKRRAATATVREAFNQAMRAAGHPGWRPRTSSDDGDWFDDSDYDDYRPS